ncbi:MAG: hypothetical protein KC420_21825, partial [Myxococcales bacterium]|nr:hypothetical protein [Myxococcales bacterium]
MASSLVVMPLEIKPVTLPEPLRASLEDPPEDPEDLREHYTSHGRTFTANGWRWGWTWIDNKRVSRRFRLRPGERKRGELRWRAGRKTTTLTRVLSAQLGAGETKDWDLVADWSVAPSGQRLFCITGYFWMKRGGTSGALYAVDLPGGAVSEIAHPNSVMDGGLEEVVAVADDEALLRTRRALRWFRREGARWQELATLRVLAGIELSYGEIDGRRIAALRCHEDKRSLFVELKGKRLIKLGEVLRPTRQVAIRDGRALVHVDGRWHAV